MLQSFETSFQQDLNVDVVTGHNSGWLIWIAHLCRHPAPQEAMFAPPGTLVGPHATAAIRLLILTAARQREILHLRWEHVDFARALLLIPDSKTGRKTIVLNPHALGVLTMLAELACAIEPSALRQSTAFVIAGYDPDKPRADLHKPTRAGLNGARIHDLPHIYASFGAGSGLGLTIIGKLLGHREAATTQRYAHLDNDPLRRAANEIGGQIAKALGS